MLFEHRTYTLKIGALDEFWQAQEDRGPELIRPILDRLVGFFAASSGSSDQVVHLYRYDSYEDWTVRLHGLYEVAALEPYFKVARPLMTAQENKFLVLAPLPELNPLWSGAQDWLPARGPVFRRGLAGREALVEETTTILQPGTMPLYWQAYREYGLGLLKEQPEQLLGCFISTVGVLHQVIHYRVYADATCYHAALGARRHNAHSQAFLRAIRPLVSSDESKLLLPTSIPALSPLFA